MTPSPFQYASSQCNADLLSKGSYFPRNVTQRQYPPTYFNSCLDSEKETWGRIQQCGGLMSICPGTKYNDPPWVRMPPQGKRFSPIGSIPLPTTYSTDILVLSFRVPLGYDGVIRYVVENYTGQGFQEGGGDLTWRIQLNQRYVKNFGATTTQIGTLTQGASSPNAEIILLSNQLVQFFVNVAPSAASDLSGGRIICSAWGYWWPR